MEEIEVIYEDDNMLVVNKPAGLLIHPALNSKEETLVDWLLEKYPEIKNVGEDPLRPGIVHRLDRDTSGVLLIAKNQKTFEFFKKQFSEREIKKRYTALVYRKMKNKSGVIDLPIGKSKKDFRKKSSIGNLSGKIREAVTEYKVIEIFEGPTSQTSYTLVEAYPKTGRTHQIRVHLKAINYPIVCDKLYGPKKLVCPYGLGRHFLHASELDVVLPDGTRMKFEADLPPDLSNVLTQLRSI